MEISTTIKIAYNKYKFFEDFLSEIENFEEIEKEKLNEFLNNSNLNLPHEVCETFINLIFDENKEAITKENFLLKYKELLILIEDEAVTAKIEDISDISIIQELDNKNEIVLVDKQTNVVPEELIDNNLPTIVREEKENLNHSEEQSEILRPDRSKYLNDEDDISIDHYNLFNNLNFENKNSSSVVKPINTFKFNSNSNARDELLDGILWENKAHLRENKNPSSFNFSDFNSKLNKMPNASRLHHINKTNKMQFNNMDSLHIPNQSASGSGPGNLINYMNNININLNNFGNFNIFDSLKTFNTNFNTKKEKVNDMNIEREKEKEREKGQSTLKQKLKEVYLALNANTHTYKSDNNICNELVLPAEDSETEELTEKEDFNSDVDRLKKNLQDGYTESNDDYFSGIYKSIKKNCPNKNYASLKSISSRIIQKAGGDIQANVEKESNANDKISAKNKFSDLRKLLKNQNTAETLNTPVDNYNYNYNINYKSNSIPHPEVNTIQGNNTFKRKLPFNSNTNNALNSFDEIEDKIKKLKKKNLANKKKNIYNTLGANIDSYTMMGSQYRNSEKKKIQNLLKPIKNILNDEEDFEMNQYERRFQTEIPEEEKELDIDN